jgi:hypothetical protein
MWAGNAPRLFGEKDPGLSEIHQECLVGLRFGLLRHAQAIRYMISEIDGTTHVSFPLLQRPSRHRDSPRTVATVGRKNG